MTSIIHSLTIEMDKGETDYFFAKEAFRRFPEAIPEDWIEKKGSVYEVGNLVWTNGQLSFTITTGLVT